MFVHIDDFEAPAFALKLFTFGGYIAIAELGENKTCQRSPCKFRQG
jgi:hypothetical protein